MTGRQSVSASLGIWLGSFVVLSAVLGVLGPQEFWYLLLMPFVLGLALAVPLGLVHHRQAQRERQPMQARTRYGMVVLIFVIVTVCWLPWPGPLIAGTNYAVALMCSAYVLSTSRTVQKP
jgi:4-hydroxybenzoate polyprenyltransferase